MLSEMKTMVTLTHKNGILMMMVTTLSALKILGYNSFHNIWIPYL